MNRSLRIWAAIAAACIVSTAVATTKLNSVTRNSGNYIGVAGRVDDVDSNTGSPDGIASGYAEEVWYGQWSANAQLSTSPDTGIEEQSKVSALTQHGDGVGSEEGQNTQTAWAFKPDTPNQVPNVSTKTYNLPGANTPMELKVHFNGTHTASFAPDTTAWLRMFYYGSDGSFYRLDVSPTENEDEWIYIYHYWFPGMTEAASGTLTTDEGIDSTYPWNCPSSSTFTLQLHAVEFSGFDFGEDEDGALNMSVSTTFNILQ